MVSLWCTYGELGELGDLSPPSPIRSAVKLPLSVCALFALAVDGFSPVFVAIEAVSVAHLIFVSE